ncbi:MAG: hypothetical protein ABH952_04800 [Candidatus Omnitrophota bacterium]
MRRVLAIGCIIVFVCMGISYAKMQESEPTPIAVEAAKNKVFSAFGAVKEVKVSKQGVILLMISDRSGSDVTVNLSELEQDATVIVTYIKKDDVNVVKTLSIVKSATAPKSKERFKQVPQQKTEE